jgi:hypothetical protein
MRCPIESPEHPELLLAYCSHQLERPTAAALEEHMRVCPGCRLFVSGQRTVSEALERWEAAPVSSDFDRRLYRRIEAEVSWWNRVMRPFRPLASRHGLPIAAAAALVIMAGVMLQRPEVPSVESLPQAAALVDAPSPDQFEHALRDMEILRELNSAEMLR